MNTGLQVQHDMNKVAVLAIAAMQNVEQTEQILLDAPQASCNIIHRFGPGVYMREMNAVAGSFIIGAYHRHEHTNILLKGRLLMVKEGGCEELVAPMIFTGNPGKKVAYILEDTVWINVYATKETDVGILEETLFYKEETSVEHLNKARMNKDTSEDQQDFLKACEDMGMTPEQVWSISCINNVVSFPHGAYKVQIATSPIHGLGLFASCDIKAGETICLTRTGNSRTPAGRYTNHSKVPNAKYEGFPNGDLFLVALRDITGSKGGALGEEITLDYRLAKQTAEETLNVS